LSFIRGQGVKNALRIVEKPGEDAAVSIVFWHQALGELNRECWMENDGA